MGVPASKTYTIRGIPAEVDAALRKKAAAKHLSLNQVVVDELVKSAKAGAKSTDLSDVAGKWEDDPAFDEIMASQRQIDWEKWK